MRMLGFWNTCAVLGVAVLATACAVRPIPDPRNPGQVRDTPLLLRVCYVDGDGAHLSVGDQVEFRTSNLGRLRIRHIPGSESQGVPWNGGDDVRVRSAVLVELVDARDQRNQQRRFVPVGRFSVEVNEGTGHERFDFLASKATANLTNDRYPECNVDLGADEVLIRGVEDDGRHGGHATLR